MSDQGTGKVLVVQASMLVMLLSTSWLGNAMPESHKLLAEGVLLGNIEQLDPAKKPSENFDLLDWTLTLPTDLNKDLKADTIYETPLSKGFELKPLFYTAADGAWYSLAQMKVLKHQKIPSTLAPNSVKCYAVATVE